MRSLLPFLCLSLAWTKTTWTMDMDMPFMVYLDSGHLVCLMWGFDSLQGHIKFKLVVNSTGWVGFGFSPNGGMKGSDIVIGGLRPTGSYFTDRHATGNAMPVVDEQQSYTLLNMTESEGQTTMTFQRPIQACDDHDFHITAQPIKIIYAYGATDDIKYHGSNRGTKELNLLNHMPRTSSNPANYFSATVDNITVPSLKTYYHCKVMRLPQLNTKHHMYQIEPVIDNPDIVHHMLLSRCPPQVTEMYDKPCYRGDQGDACMTVVASWGVGGGVFELPENVGIPIGDRESDTYRLVIYYSNPEAKSGITDSSGLRLYYTAELRQHDVGILFTGLLPMGKLQYNIPPKANLFRMYGSCDTTHFSQLVGPWTDLHVFALLLHTHLAGRKVRVGHFRNGTQVDFLGLDENYNFEFQQTVSLGSIKTIQLGDEIAIECTYSTTNRSEVTKLGLATSDAMCLAFLFYYPEIPVASCVSHPDTTNVSTKTRAKTSTQNPIYDDAGAYETLLKTVPQVQMITSHDNQSVFHSNGTIKDLMETPTVACTIDEASHSPGISWIVSPTGIIILLLSIVIL